jgi:hypothetical protein
LIDVLACRAISFWHQRSRGHGGYLDLRVAVRGSRAAADE